MRRVVILLIIVIVGVVALVSMPLIKEYTQHVIDANTARRSNAAGQKLSDKMDEYYILYVTQTRDKARQSLLDEISFLKGVKDSDLRPDLQPTYLSLTYRRLFVLEHKSGNEAAASLAFDQLIACDKLVSEIMKGHTIGTPKEATPDKCIEWVEKQDNYLTDNKGPRYLLDVSSTSSRP